MPQHQHPASRRILIAGDPAVGRGLMKLVLDRLGYVVTCVGSGRDVLSVVGHTRFALIIVALQLTDVSGLALARRLRAANGPAGDVPLLLFGDAWDRNALSNECRELAVEAYLPKPISIGRLVEIVRDLTSTGRGAAADMPTTPPIDTGHFLSFTAGDAALEGELAELYLTSARDYLKQMRARLDDPAAWESLAHALKGASANIGATSMAALAADAEHGQPDAGTLARLETALEEVARFFRERIRQVSVEAQEALPISA